MLNFIANTPNTKIKNQHAHLKFALHYLQNGGKAEVLSHLAQNPKLGVTDKQIRNAAKTFKLNKDDVKTISQVVRANSLSIPGLFFPEIGITLFDQGSMFNHSCDPNTFIFLTYDKMIVFARKVIAIDEEITFRYVPSCIPESFKLLSFECQCGKCNQVSLNVKEIYEKWSHTTVPQLRIDYLLDRTDEILSTERVKLLVESYYEIWIHNNTYREDDLYNILRKFKLQEPDTTWIESQFLLLVLAFRLGRSDHLPEIKERLQPFLNNKDIIEHIVVCTTMVPHIYHNSLIEILMKMGVTP